MVKTAIRAVAPATSPRGIALRGEVEGDGRTLFGHFATFNSWTEVDSWREGHFLEKIAPGAFTRTFQENFKGIRVLLSHGFDPVVGDKPIAAIQALREDAVGAAYEARLLDGVPELVVSGLSAGLYGASFRFRVLREQFDQAPAPSDYNPGALPERTVLEARVVEFGPVAFPQYKDATAGLRSQFDEWAEIRDGGRRAA